MDSILSDIKIIDHNNKFIKYIIERIKRDKYRGTHVSQHNRYDLSDITNMIQSIYKTVDNNIFEIPRGDYNRNFNDNDLIGTFKEYKDIVDNIKKTTGKGTYNSVKKNFFVVIDESEDVLYLKCIDLAEAKREVKRYLGVSFLDDRVEIFFK
jgi:two-component system OmpR family sensor kinase